MPYTEAFLAPFQICIIKFCEKALTIFTKKAPLYMFSKVLNTPMIYKIITRNHCEQAKKIASKLLRL